MVDDVPNVIINFNDSEKVQLVLNKLTNIQVLNIEQCYNFNLYDFVDRLTNLRILSLGFYRDIKILETFLTRLPKLRELKITIYKNGLESSLFGLNNLDSLIIYNYDDDDDDLPELKNSLKDLINLRSLTIIGPMIVDTPLTYLSNLEYLTFKHFNESLLDILDGLPKLKCINVSSDYKMTNIKEELRHLVKTF